MKQTAAAFILFLGVFMPLYCEIYANANNDSKKTLTEILIKGITSDNEAIRNDAIRYIGELKIDQPHTKTRILQTLTYDRSAYIRAAAIYTLGQLEGMSAKPQISKELEYNGKQAYIVHLAAASALYSMGDKNQLNIIKKYISSGNPAEAIEATVYAASLNNPDVIPLLKNNTNAKDHNLRLTSLESLAQLGQKIPDEEIQILLTNGDIWAAIKIIRNTNNLRFKSQLKRELNSSNELIQIEAAATLIEQGEKKYKANILKYIGKDSHHQTVQQDVQLYAMDTLSRIGNKSDIPLLKEFVHHQQIDRLSITAASSILKILNKK